MMNQTDIAKFLSGTTSQTPPPSQIPLIAFHVMVKPIGPVCNLDCDYCYYLSKKDLLHMAGDMRIADDVLEEHIRRNIEIQDVNTVNFSWQGGEPTLLGIEFFQKVLDLQKKYCPPHKVVTNDLQTNGTLLDDDWCRFLHDNKFLVGLSIDGPKELHDAYRKDRKGHSTFDKILRAVELMTKHNVEFNTLTVVNYQNAKHPLEVYRFLRDQIGSKFIQLIPCVEPKDFAATAPQHWDKNKLPPLGSPAARPHTPESIVTDWTVDPDDYGRFLCTIFDEWLRNDVGAVFVHLFEYALALWMGQPSPACYFAEVCGKALAMEHDGCLYSCDHYVYPEYRLGNITETPLRDMVLSEKQVRFSLDKTQSLPQYCRQCKYLFVCHGECPKNRLILTPDNQPDLNYLCTGLKHYFEHIDPWMKKIAKELNAGRPAINVMHALNKKENSPLKTSPPKPRAKLNAPCPCGSGRKYKKCCYSKEQNKVL